MYDPDTTRPGRVVIVGAGVAGVRTAKALRCRGFAGQVVLLSDEDRLPYDRPPLTKQILRGTWHHDEAQLMSAAQFDELDIDLRLRTRVVGLGRNNSVRLADGSSLTADYVVLATGSLPHRLADQPQDPRVHVVNNLEDILRLQAAFQGSSTLLIVGAGLIGGEVATAARAAGLDVDLVDAQPEAFTRALGPVGGALLAARHRELGVRVHTGRWPEAWHTDDAGVHLELDDGSRLTADHAVVAVGARPALDWLLDAPETNQPMLQANLEQGLACDSDGRVIGTSALYAVGDSAAWADPGTGVRTRGQHWTLAIEHAEVVAAVIAARASTTETDADSETPFPTVGPAYMWTDQAGVKVQVLGDPHLGEQHLSLATPGGGTVVLTSDRGHVVAVTLVATPRALGAARAVVVDAVTTETALARLRERVELRPSTFDAASR